MILKLKSSNFLMAKRLKRRLAQQNKDRAAGCMSGIISVFDFRHGRITRRMLQDHSSQMTESTTVPSYPTSEVNSFIDLEEMREQIEFPNNEESEAAHTRVKELMEEEMQCDQTGDHEDLYPEISTDHRVPSQRTSQYRDLEDFVNKLLEIHQIGNEEEKPKSLERSNSLDHERNNPTLEEPVTRRNRNFFRRRRSKSHECLSLNDNNTPLPSNRTNRFHHERSVSHFSFTEIKKKLKKVIQRSPRDSGYQDKPVVNGNSGWSSPNRDHFYSERFSRISNGFKGQDEVSRLCKSERKPSANVEFGDRSDRISNIYVEAKKHLSEMLNNGDEETELLVESHSRCLGKLLSFPEYKYSSRGNSPKVNEIQPFVKGDDYQELEISDVVHQAEGIVEITKPPTQERNEVLDALHLTEDELPCSPLASPSSSSLAINRKTEEVESILDDKTGKPSPVSVLEPLYSDDDISPARTISRSNESSFQPLRIQFKEETITPAEYQETCIPNHVENEESVFEYVEAVLLASDLNWHEFEQRWLSSVQILDSSLYHELQLFSSRPTHDQRLFFDITNEILQEICDHSLGSYGELSYLKPNISTYPKGMNLINEVWKRIESRLNCHYRISLDQLIEKDLEVSRTWTDLHSDTREVVMELEESMFDDMLDDMVLSLMQD